MKHLIDQPLGTNVFHAHLERTVPDERNVQLSALFGVETTFDAVVHESHQSSGNHNAGNGLESNIELPVWLLTQPYRLLRLESTRR